jgi:hypothetical protein
MKRVLKRLHETRVGDSTMRRGLTVVSGGNGEAWKGRIADISTLRNGKTFYYIENAVSDSGKVRSFNKEVVEIITDLEIAHGFYEYPALASYPLISWSFIKCFIWANTYPLK